MKISFGLFDEYAVSYEKDGKIYVYCNHLVCIARINDQAESPLAGDGLAILMDWAWDHEMRFHEDGYHPGDPVR